MGPRMKREGNREENLGGGTSTNQNRDERGALCTGLTAGEEDVRGSTNDAGDG